MTKTHEKCPKNQNFSELFFVQFFNIKIVFCQNVIVLVDEMAEKFEKNEKNTKKTTI